MGMLGVAKGSRLPWVVKEAMRHSDFSLTQRYTDVSLLPTEGAFLGLPSFVPERAGPAKKRTNFPDADGQNTSPRDTLGELAKVVEILENKGDSHVLAWVGAAGPETEAGSKGRTRTVFTAKIHGFPRVSSTICANSVLFCSTPTPLPSGIPSGSWRIESTSNSDWPGGRLKAPEAQLAVLRLSQVPDCRGTKAPAVPSIAPAPLASWTETYHAARCAHRVLSR
jgi:hypothetical protein